MSRHSLLTPKDYAHRLRGMPLDDLVLHILDLEDKLDKTEATVQQQNDSLATLRDTVRDQHDQLADRPKTPEMASKIEQQRAALQQRDRTIGRLTEELEQERAQHRANLDTLRKRINTLAATRPTVNDDDDLEVLKSAISILGTHDPISPHFRRALLTTLLRLFDFAFADPGSPTTTHFTKDVHNG